MLKTIYTPRDELVCDKMDVLHDKLILLSELKANEKLVRDCINLLLDMSYDVTRMEQKLIYYKTKLKVDTVNP